MKPSRSSNILSPTREYSVVPRTVLVAILASHNCNMVGSRNAQTIFAHGKEWCIRYEPALRAGSFDFQMYEVTR
jgi:hypothetical protein